MGEGGSGCWLVFVYSLYYLDSPPLCRSCEGWLWSVVRASVRLSRYVWEDIGREMAAWVAEIPYVQSTQYSTCTYLTVVH